MKSLAIEREYGTGGLEIGKMVAKEKGIPIYGELDIIKEAEKMGCKLTLLKDYEEKKKESILYNIAMIANFKDEQKLQIEGLMQELFVELEETSFRLHQKGPAVFIGMGISQSAKMQEDFVKVFIQGSADVKIAYLHKGKVHNEIEKTMQIKDKQRSAYFHLLTHKEWKKDENYDFTFDVSKITREDIAKKISIALG